jgi:hypothetical protein
LWKAVTGAVAPGWQLDGRDLHLLERAARCADEIAALETVVDEDGPIVVGSRKQPVAHPALQEARQLRLVEMRLLAAVELRDPAAKFAGASPASRRGAKAAATRWAGETRRMRAV